MKFIREDGCITIDHIDLFTLKTTVFSKFESVLLMRIYRSINIHKSYHVRDLVQVSIGGRKVRTLGMGDYVGMAPRCGFLPENQMV